MDEREKIHYELLDALGAARNHAKYIEAALAHNAAYMGTGIEREKRPEVEGNWQNSLPEALVRYFCLIDSAADISDYIDCKGHNAGRPGHGPGGKIFLHPGKTLAPVPEMDKLAIAPTANAAIFDSSARNARDKTNPEATDPAFSFSDGGVEICALDPFLSSLFTYNRSSGEEACGDSIWDWNIQTNTLCCSHRWLEILGNPSEGPALEALVSTFHPIDQDVIRKQLAELLEGSSNKMRTGVHFLKNGKPGWGILQAVALREYDRVVRLVATLADITVYREAETPLHESSKALCFLTDHSPDVTFRFSPQGEIIYVSKNISRYDIFGPDEMVGKHVSEMGFSAELLDILGNIFKVFANGQPVQAEGTLTSPLVGTFVIACRFWPEYSLGGDVVSVLLQARDMTHARRMAENYYALFNNMSDGFVLFEHLPGWEGGPPRHSPDEFAVVVTNPAFSRMFGLKHPRDPGARITELMNADAETWSRCLERVLAKGLPVTQSLRSEITHGEYNISAYSPEPGRVACILRDVTELHRIEQGTRLNEARLVALYRLSRMDAAPENLVGRYCLEQAVNLTGSAFGYLYVSGGEDGEQGTLYWSKCARPEGDHEKKVESDDDLPWHNFGKISPIRGPEVVNMAEGDFSSAFGAGATVDRYMLAPIAEDGRILCLAGVANKKEPYSPSDIRQLELFMIGTWFQMRRRRSLQALQRAKEEAEAASRTKNEFLANVSHELRTPLNGILSLLQVLQQSSLTGEQMECVRTAAYSSRSLLRIISDILDFSRIESGTFTLSPQLFDFVATVRSALGMFIYPASNGQVSLNILLDKNIPNLLVGDDARVRQIIVNLVGNAFKFTHQGEISVECRLLPFSRHGKKNIYLSVRDTGIGIPEDRQEHIFKAFTQLDGSSTRRYSGTGLGLAIVQRLVHLMDGTLVVESAPGEGTTLHCSLSFAESGPQAEQKSDSPIHFPPPELLDLLVVEDDAVNRFALQALLNKIGYSSTCVSNGMEALAALTLRAFDCVITDIQMPVMDGMEMTRRIRQGDNNGAIPTRSMLSLLGIESLENAARFEVPRDIPIIALTAHAMGGDRERFLGIGMDYYLAKPIILSELATILAHVGTLVRARLGY